MFIMIRFRVLNNYEYTLSILFAGLTCCPPALGVATPLLIFAVVATFCAVFERKYRDDAVTLALFERECTRNTCINEVYIGSALRVLAQWDNEFPDLTFAHIDAMPVGVAMVLRNDSAYAPPTLPPPHTPARRTDLFWHLTREGGACLWRRRRMQAKGSLRTRRV